MKFNVFCVLTLLIYFQLSKGHALGFGDIVDDVHRREGIYARPVITDDRNDLWPIYLKCYSTLTTAAFNILYDASGTSRQHIPNSQLRNAANHLLYSAYLEPYFTERPVFKFISGLDRYINLPQGSGIYSIYEEGHIKRNIFMEHNAINLFINAWLISESLQHHP